MAQDAALCSNQARYNVNRYICESDLEVAYLGWSILQQDAKKYPPVIRPKGPRELGGTRGSDIPQHLKGEEKAKPGRQRVSTGTGPGAMMVPHSPDK